MDFSRSCDWHNPLYRVCYLGCYVYTSVILGTLTDDMDPLDLWYDILLGWVLLWFFFAEWVLLCL